MSTPPTFTGGATQTDLLWWQQSRPLAYLYQSTAQTGVASTTWTAVALQTALVDRDGGHSGSSGQYTVGLTLGIYRVSGAVAFDGTGGTERSARLVLNGTPIPGSLVQLPAAGPCTVTIPSVEVISTAPGDYVELQCQHDAGSPLNLLVVSGQASQMRVEYTGN